MTETTIVQARAVWSPTTPAERKAFLAAVVKGGEARITFRSLDSLSRDVTSTLVLDAESMAALATLATAMNVTLARNTVTA